jgi:hypothetical protein
MRRWTGTIDDATLLVRALRRLIISATALVAAGAAFVATVAACR